MRIDRKILILISNEGYFTEFANAMAAGLGRLGFSVEIAHSIPDSGKVDGVLVIGLHDFRRLPFLRDIPLLGIQTEQFPLLDEGCERSARNLKIYSDVRGYYHTIFEWNPGLYQAGFGDVFIPYGCQHKKPVDCEKKWDVLFIGNVDGSARRLDYLEYLKERFRVFPEFDPGFGARKTQAIAESRICLNIHYYDDGGFESPRVFDCLSEKAFVLSEHASSTTPFSVGEDLDEFSDKYELADKIAYYLSHEERRRQISEQGYRTANKHSFEITAQAIAVEMDKALNNPAGKPTRLMQWSRSRFSAHFRDVCETLRS